MIRSLLDRLDAEGLEASSWSNGPGDRYPVHAHDYDKVLVVASGSIVFELPTRSEAVEMSEGDRLDLPAGTAHAALVGSSGVTCLEAHLVRGSLGSAPLHDRGWGTRPLAREHQGSRE